MSSGSISSQNNVHPGNKYIKYNQELKKEEILYDNSRALSVYEIMLLTGLDINWDPPTNNEKLVRDIIGEAIPPKLVKILIDNLPI
jgi:site-specific DNA-cytosine methylase